MGRRPSNVYDYFERIDPPDGKGQVRYECKKCQKQYASNATRLAEHLKQSGCSPSFQSNQPPIRPSNSSSSSNVNHSNNISSSSSSMSVVAATAAAAAAAAAASLSSASGAFPPAFFFLLLSSGMETC